MQMIGSKSSVFSYSYGPLKKRMKCLETLVRVQFSNTIMARPQDTAGGHSLKIWSTLQKSGLLNKMSRKADWGGERALEVPRPPPPPVPK
jgi:hypothetical protein